MYNGYYGDNVDDNDPSAPAYDVDAVISSPASQAIADTTGIIMTPKKILQLRSNSMIVCKSFNKYANCSSRCLFDLRVDPCETTDISEQHPEVSRLSINLFSSSLLYYFLLQHNNSHKRTTTVTT